MFMADYAVKTLECDSGADTLDLTDTIMVTANRSWSARVSEGTDFIELEDSGCQILSGVSTKRSLELGVSHNKEPKERLGCVTIFSEGDSIKVKIYQKAWRAKISVGSGVDDLSAVPSRGAAVPLEIFSNTRWTISTDTNDEAAVYLSQNEGEYSAIVIATVAPNADSLSVGKGATITIKAEGCNDIDIPVKQPKKEVAL